MTEITIFTAPKPFTNPHINIIQRNAIRSWKELGPRVNVLMIGDEEGMAEAASDIGVIHVTDVEKNDLGTPLVSSIFEMARRLSQSDIYIYANADIIFPPGILDILDDFRSRRKSFLLVGQRWDLDLDSAVDFSGPWQEELQKEVSDHAVLKSQTAMDYFIFTKDLYQDIPPFAIGRAGWDNWMIYQALQRNWFAVDLTAAYKVVHQNHDYSHLPNGVIHHKLDESLQNVKLAGGMQTNYDLLDVTLSYQDRRIKKKRITVDRVLRILERIVLPAEQSGWRWRVTLFLRRSQKNIF